MKTILSQDFKGKLTYVTVAKNVKGILKQGFKINHKGERLDKPNGIWLSVDDGWEKWKDGEEFRPEDDAVLQASIPQDLKLLVIDSLDDFLSWQNDFSKDHPIIGTGDGMDIEMRRMAKATGFNIDDFIKHGDLAFMKTFGISFVRYNPKLWEWTESKVDGVLMTEEGQWATRMKTFMYGWDCATLMMFNEKHVKFSNPKFFLTTVEECHLCKGKGYMDFGKMFDDVKKKDKDIYPMPKALRTRMPCPHCGAEGKLVVSSQIKKRVW